MYSFIVPWVCISNDNNQQPEIPEEKMEETQDSNPEILYFDFG